MPDSQVMSDLDAAVVFANASGRADTAKLGITGFCWGGRITWLYSAHNPGVKAGVAWYGRLVGQANELQPKHPVDLAGALKAEGKEITESPVSAQHLGELVALIVKGELSGKLAKEVFPKMFSTGDAAAAIVLAAEVLDAAAHGAVHNFIRAAAHELAGEGISLNGIALGWMDYMDDRIDRADPDGQRAARFPMLRRLGEAGDIGATAVWLSSPEGARYIVGDVIPIDGGLLQHQ